MMACHHRQTPNAEVSETTGALPGRAQAESHSSSLRLGVAAFEAREAGAGGLHLRLSLTRSESPKAFLNSGSLLLRLKSFCEDLMGAVPRR